MRKKPHDKILREKLKEHHLCTIRKACSFINIEGGFYFLAFTLYSKTIQTNQLTSSNNSIITRV